MMHLARLRRPGPALALFTEARFRTLVLAAATLMVASCTSDPPTEPAGPVNPPVALNVIGCPGCFYLDHFTDPDGTLLEDHVPDGEGITFSWLRTVPGYQHSAMIRHNALVQEESGYWRYVTSSDVVDTTVVVDTAEIELEVLRVMPGQTNYSVGLIFRAPGPGGVGGFGGYTAFWSVDGNGFGFFEVDRGDENGSVLLFQDEPAIPSVGTHTFAASVSKAGVINLYVDGSLKASVTDPSPLPAGDLGLQFGFSGDSGVMRITSFVGRRRPESRIHIEPVSEPMEVWPKGVPGGSPEVQLRVRVDAGGTNVKDKWVRLSLTGVDSSGTGSDQPYGHYHKGVGAAEKPAGKLSEDSVNTGPTGLEGVVRYTSSPVSGPVLVRAEMEGGLPDSLTIPVGVPGLEQLAPNGTFTLVGVTPIHPSSHWVTVDMRSRLIQLAQIVHENHAKKVGFNDASLPFGGKFDLNKQWGDTDPTCEFTKDGVTKKNPIGCHQTHRRGVDLDLDIASLTKEERTRVRTRWAAIAKLSVINEGNHFHLAYRP